MCALKVIHWLAKEEVAHTTKFQSLVELAIDLGAKDLKALNKGENAKYTSERTIQEMVHVLSATVEEEILEDIHSSPLVGLLCDESTDIAVTNQLVVYARYIKNGKAYTRFLKIKELTNGSAPTIERALLELCTEGRIPLEKIAAFGSDGAPVMIGRREGVAAKLKVHIPHLVSIHCAAHRLALATSHASEKVPYIKRYSKLLESIYHFYQKSTTRQVRLHQMQQVFGDPNLKLKEPKHVRWLSHRMNIGYR